MGGGVIIEEVIMTPPAGPHFNRPFVPRRFFDFFPINGPKAEWFILQASDYDVGDDEMVCPCGETIERPVTLGEMLGEARAHIRKAHGKC
jgi:hypothetical protein